MNGTHLVVSVRAGSLRYGGLPPACPRQRVAGGSSQGHINQTFHLPLSQLSPCSSLYPFPTRLVAQNNEPFSGAGATPAESSLSDSGHFTAEPWTLFTLV